MQNHRIRFALALGFLVCGAHMVTAQQISSNAPIMVQLAEIDCFGVWEWAPAKGPESPRLGLPYRDMEQSDVETLVSVGVAMNRSVWIMVGQRVVAECSLVGEFVCGQDAKSKSEYGLLVRLDSVTEAQTVGAELRLERLKVQPSLDELIRRGKNRLNDERFWIP